MTLNELEKFFLIGLAEGVLVNVPAVWALFRFVLHDPDGWGYWGAAAIWIPVVIGVIAAFRRAKRRVDTAFQQMTQNMRDQRKGAGSTSPRILTSKQTVGADFPMSSLIPPVEERAKHWRRDA